MRQAIGSFSSTRRAYCFQGHGSSAVGGIFFIVLEGKREKKREKRKEKREGREGKGGKEGRKEKRGKRSLDHTYYGIVEQEGRLRLLCYAAHACHHVATKRAMPPHDPLYNGFKWPDRLAGFEYAVCGAATFLQLEYYCHPPYSLQIFFGLISAALSPSSYRHRHCAAVVVAVPSASLSCRRV